MMIKPTIAIVVLGVAFAIQEKPNMIPEQNEILKLSTEIESLQKRISEQEREFTDLVEEQRKLNDGKDALSGVPLHPENPVAFHVTKLSDFFAAGEQVPINFEMVNLNVGGGWSSFLNRFIAPVKGVYFFRVKGYGTQLTACRGWIRHTTSTGTQTDIQFVDAHVGFNSAGGTAILQMEANDVVDFTLSDSYSIRGEGRSHFIGFLLHPL